MTRPTSRTGMPDRPGDDDGPIWVITIPIPVIMIDRSG
jgi:hypothetical protein